MAKPREIKEKVKAVSAIETIAVTYQEVSQNKMNEIRETALGNRKFIEKLSLVYASAKDAYLRDKEEEIDLLAGKKDAEVVVFISANARFYGALIWKVWVELRDYLQKNRAELVVLGEVGKFMAENAYGDEFEYFDIDDEEPGEDQVKKLIDFIENYKKITVFHGKFKNILNQEAAITDISGQISEREAKEEASYLFEPSPKKVLEFFEKELITAFFNQSFLEHRLSRHATRMVAMHRASNNAQEEIEGLKQEEIRMKRRLLDKKQFEITTPYQLWK